MAVMMARASPLSVIVPLTWTSLPVRLNTTAPSPVVRAVAVGGEDHRAAEGDLWAETLHPVVGRPPRSIVPLPVGDTTSLGPVSAIAAYPPAPPSGSTRLTAAIKIPVEQTPTGTPTVEEPLASLEQGHRRVLAEGRAAGTTDAPVGSDASDVPDGARSETAAHS